MRNISSRLGWIALVAWMAAGCGGGGDGAKGGPEGSNAAGSMNASGARQVAGGGVVAVAQTIGDWEGAAIRRTEYLSPVYTIDRIYKSMQGPLATEPASLTEPGEPELLWITGYSVVVTGPDGTTPVSPEFMCHVNMNVDSAPYREIFPTRMQPIGGRLFSLDQGTHAVKFPPGFGIPTRSDLPVLLNTQVLNHNVVGEPFDVRQRLRIDFIRDRDLKKPLKALTNCGVFGMTLVDGPDGNFNVDPALSNPGQHGPGCDIAADMSDGMGLIDDGKGRKFTSFWVVKPGRHVYHTRVTPLMRLAYDTRVHFISAHLHPYAESIELFDLTAGKTVHKLMAKQAEGKLGLASVETFASAEGLPLHANHEYDLIATYDNPTGEDQDAMASLLLYVQARDVEPVADAGSSQRRLRKTDGP